MQVSLAGCRNPVTRRRRFDGNPVEAVRPCEGCGRGQAEMPVHLLLLRRREVKASIAAARGRGHAFRRCRPVAVRLDPHRAARIDGIGNSLHSHPEPGKPGKVEALHAKFEKLGDIGGIEDRDIPASMKAKSL